MKGSSGEFMFLVILQPSTFTHHFRNTDNCLPLVPHQSHRMICSEPVTPEWSARIHHWPSAPLLIPSIGRYRDIPLRLSPHPSLTPLSSDISSLSFSLQNSVLLYSCIIQSKFHQHCNQSLGLSCGLSLTWRASDVWAVTSPFVHRNPRRNAKVCKHSRQLRTTYFHFRDICFRHLHLSY